MTTIAPLKPVNPIGPQFASIEQVDGISTIYVTFIEATGKTNKYFVWSAQHAMCVAHEKLDAMVDRATASLLKHLARTGQYLEQADLRVSTTPDAADESIIDITDTPAEALALPAPSFVPLVDDAAFGQPCTHSGSFKPQLRDYQQDIINNLPPVMPVANADEFRFKFLPVGPAPEIQEMIERKRVAMLTPTVQFVRDAIEGEPIPDGLSRPIVFENAYGDEMTVANVARVAGTFYIGGPWFDGQDHLFLTAINEGKLTEWNERMGTYSRIFIRFSAEDASQIAWNLIQHHFGMPLAPYVTFDVLPDFRSVPKECMDVMGEAALTLGKGFDALTKQLPSIIEVINAMPLVDLFQGDVDRLRLYLSGHLR